MKNLIVILTISLSLLIAEISFAQTFGIKGGINFSNILIKDDGEKISEDFKYKTGFHIGPTIEFPINETWSFESALLFSTKGTKMNEKETYNNETYESEAKINLQYLDIPLTAKIFFDIGETNLYGNIGPYIGIGLKGKSKYDYSSPGESESDEEDIKFGSDEDLKRIDFGLSTEAGIEIQSFSVGLFYNLGLANIAADGGEGKINNRVFGISTAYKFNKE